MGLRNHGLAGAAFGWASAKQAVLSSGFGLGAGCGLPAALAEFLHQHSGASDIRQQVRD